jgi:hypothetical protein
MFGLVSFSDLKLSWNDPIPWEASGVFTKDRPGLMNTLIFTYFFSLFFHFAIYNTMKWLAGKHARSFLAPSSEYFKMTDKVKKEYYSRNVSDIHALISSAFALHAVFFSCSESGQNFFTSDACAMTPNVASCIGILFSAGYCTYDLIICVFEVKFTWLECRDYVYHHVVGTIGGTITIISGYYMT